jgi:dTMP kinase
MFIVFEGIDGSGTSTQAKKLYETLKKENNEVILTQEPSNLFLGKILRDVLQNKIKLQPKSFQLLFFADRSEHLETVIKPAIKNNQIVICERYNWSTIAYGIASGISKELLHSISKSFLYPDYTILLNLDNKAAINRINKRGKQIEYFENLQVLNLVQQELVLLCKNNINSKTSYMFDANEPIEKLSRKIYQNIFRDYKKK